ncbi:MAG: hypothetical protein IJU98_11700, partial [Synergistaceae bacterium]|nr:hypothetical protein [Synergistaceae bacterium]
MQSAVSSQRRFLTFSKFALLAFLFAAFVAPGWADTVLNGTETTLAGYCVVNSDITFDHTITLTGDVILELAENATMTVNTTETG